MSFHPFIFFLALTTVCAEESTTKMMKAPRSPSLAKRHELSFSEDDYKMLNFSCVMGIDEKTNKIVAGDFENETAALFERVKMLVESNNSSMDQVESLKFRMVDLTWSYIVNNNIRKYFQYPYPGSTLIEIDPILPMNATIDVEVIAHVPLPSKGYDKTSLRGRHLDRNNTEYMYQLHEIPGRSP